MKKTVENFQVPELTIDPEYDAPTKRLAALHEKLRSLKIEGKALDKQIKAAPPARYGSGVAALLGEDTDSTSGQRQRLAEVRRAERDTETAITVLSGRVSEQRTKASRVVVEACRAEYGRRVANVVAALRTVEAARAEYDDLRDQFETADVQWTSLGPLSLGFLGEARDGRIAAVIRDAEANGYV